MKSFRELAHDLRVEAHTVWLCARDPGLAWPVRLFGMAIAAYALSPIDLIPDFVPIVGLLDDAVLVPAGLWLFAKLVPAEMHARHRATAEAASHRPVSRAGAAVIGFIWIAALVWLATLLWSLRYW